METAFREHYDHLGGMLYQFFNCKDPQERQAAQIITSLEYENLVTALNLALEAQISIHNPYFALSLYLDATQDQNRGLQLGQSVLHSLETYQTNKLECQIGLEFAHAFLDVANRQCNLKRYAEADISYQKVLELVSHLVHLNKKECTRLKASTYHQLGIMAQEQHQREQAGEYFLQALEILVGYKEDTYSGVVVLQSLAHLRKASGDAKLPAAIATILDASLEETEKLLRDMLGEE